MGSRRASQGWPVRRSTLAIIVALLGAALLGMPLVRELPHRFMAAIPALTPSSSGQPLSLRRTAPERMIEELEALSAPPMPSVTEASRVSYDPRGLRDPFIGPLHVLQVRRANQPPPVATPEVVQPPTPPTLTVQGIIWTENAPYAIVNDEPVRPGEMIEGVEVAAIEPDAIVVKFQGLKLRYRISAARSSGETTALSSAQETMPEPSSE